MTKIYAVYCPNCQKQTPLSTRIYERLKEMEIECAACHWKGFADTAKIQEENFDDWFTSTKKEPSQEEMAQQIKDLAAKNNN